ncbi:MAG: type II toxin-antitoxin system VapC family toxin [Verrucomicrobiota bacterium]
MVFDTNFLISLSGKSKHLPRARALAFQATHDGAPAYIARVTEMEFAAGFDTAAAANRYLSLFTTLPIDEDIWQSGTEIFRQLRREGLKIGMADTLIAAAALTYGLPVVTDNTAHFKRVPGLRVLGY